ncbi:MAG TPA: NAD-dependent epimerase/dehydratase family protein [Terriglobia bacterium]|nr:NAD-dependent epimerase/dehydratase family protein [Terriglobia bacterium]
MKLRLAITGSGGYLAQQLITRLGADADCEFILGFDIRPREPEVACPAVFLRYDLTSPWTELRDYFRSRDINCALHLAWQFNPIHDAKRHRQVDVEGSANFFRAAEAAGVKRVVYTSSTTAYTDAWNPETPLSEDAPVRGTPRYLYSKHKGEVDRMAQEFARQHPEIQVLILRPSIVVGPHTQNIVSKMTEWPWPAFPWMFQVRGADPPMQYLSEDDIGEILYRAVKSEVCGTFNCAGDGVVRLTELARMMGKRPLPVPAGLLYGQTGLLWALGLAPFPAGILDMIRYPWVADNTRLKTVFGYTPRLTSRQALETFAAAHRVR